MAKRVSLKGKGADIFFGDYAPPGMSASERWRTPRETTTRPSMSSRPPSNWSPRMTKPMSDSEPPTSDRKIQPKLSAPINAS